MNEHPTPCPDDRIVLARRGAVDALEWESLMAHVQTCAACRAAWLVARSFEGTASRQPEDEQLVRRVVTAALGALGSPVATGRTSTRVGAGAGVTAKTLLLRRGFRSAFVVATAVILMAAAASAGALIHRHLRTPAPVLLDQTAAPRPDERKNHRRRAIRPTPAVALQTPATVPEAPPEIAPEPVPEPAPPPVRPIATAPRRAVRPLASRCAALFASATVARGAGHPIEAIALFRRLGRECPGTPEATVSLVSVGELLIDAQDLESALASFEVYLRLTPSGPLAPEALAAKTRLLERLGRRSEADQARSQLQRRIPQWPYASDHPDAKGSSR